MDFITVSEHIWENILTISQEEMEIPDWEKWAMRKKKISTVWVSSVIGIGKKISMDGSEKNEERVQCTLEWKFGCNPKSVELNGRTNIGFKEY